MGFGLLDAAKFGISIYQGYTASEASKQRGENAYNQNMANAQHASLNSERNYAVSRSNASLSRLDAAVSRELSGMNASAMRAEAGDWQRVTDLNVQEYMAQADYARWKGGFVEDRLWEDMARLRGEQEMAYLHTGVTIDDGSPVDMAMDTVRNFAIDAFVVRTDTEEDVRHLLAMAEIEKETGGVKVRSLLRSASLEVRRGALQARRYSAQAGHYDMQAAYDLEQGELYSDTYTATAQSESDYQNDLSDAQIWTSVGGAFLELYS